MKLIVMCILRWANKTLGSSEITAEAPTSKNSSARQGAQVLHPQISISLTWAKVFPMNMAPLVNMPSHRSLATTESMRNTLSTKRKGNKISIKPMNQASLWVPMNKVIYLTKSNKKKCIENGNQNPKKLLNEIRNGSLILKRFTITMLKIQSEKSHRNSKFQLSLGNQLDLKNDKERL